MAQGAKRPEPELELRDAIALMDLVGGMAVLAAGAPLLAPTERQARSSISRR